MALTREQRAVWRELVTAGILTVSANEDVFEDLMDRFLNARRQVSRASLSFAVPAFGNTKEFKALTASNAWRNFDWLDLDVVEVNNTTFARSVSVRSVERIGVSTIDVAWDGNNQVAMDFDGTFALMLGINQNHGGLMIAKRTAARVNPTLIELTGRYE